MKAAEIISAYDALIERLRVLSGASGDYLTFDRGPTRLSCGEGEVTAEYAYGDEWDGYCVLRDSFEIGPLDMGEEEFLAYVDAVKAETKKAQENHTAQMVAQKAAQERAIYESLKAKFEQPKA
jgi:hypothetical protein